MKSIRLAIGFFILKNTEVSFKNFQDQSIQITLKNHLYPDLLRHAI